MFRQRGREREREGEKHQCVVVSQVPPIGNLACNPGVCPDRESNWQPCRSQASAQSTDPHQPGCFLFLKIVFIDSIQNQTKVHMILNFGVKFKKYFQVYMEIEVSESTQNNSGEEK